MKLAAAAITPGLANIGQYGTLPSAKSIQSGRCLLGRPHSPARARSGTAAKAAMTGEQNDEEPLHDQSMSTTGSGERSTLESAREPASHPSFSSSSLLAATAAAFAFAQRAKLEESPIQGIRFERRLLSPVCTACDPSAREVPVRFRLLNEDHVTVDIVDCERGDRSRTTPVGPLRAEVGALQLGRPGWPRAGRG